MTFLTIVIQIKGLLYMILNLSKCSNNSLPIFFLSSGEIKLPMKILKHGRPRGAGECNSWVKLVRAETKRGRPKGLKQLQSA